ncbi:MAG: hypothetical protein JRI55_23985, partial [Deltaproteobacteria bacterium]|nr:hypothetical protein [Deltaproteobacteria bacterium]
MTRSSSLPVVAVAVALAAQGCASEPGGCDSPVPELTVAVHVTALFKDGDNNPIADTPATVDIYKVTCSGETKRAKGTPMQGKSDGEGRFITPMIIGYTLHDAMDAIYIDASAACGRVHRRFAPGDLKAHTFGPAWEAEITVCPALEIESPTDGDGVVVGRTVQFRGTTGCDDATVTFVADGKHTFGTLNNVNGPFSLDHAFNSPGKNRTVEISVKNSQGCTGSRTLTLTVQPALAHSSETITQKLADNKSCQYTLHSVTVPLVDQTIDVAGIGTETAQNTVADLA